MSTGLARRRALAGFARSLRIPTAALTGGLLDVALTHDSFAAERGPSAPGLTSNERLEFLGDAVVGLVVAHALFQRHPDLPEGALSRMRAALVSRAGLAQTAQRLQVGAVLLLGKGERTAGGAERPKILASTLEAIAGAIYLSSGFAAARSFIEREHLAHAGAGGAGPSSSDPKTALQEYTQARFKKAPHYAVVAQSGPAHARTFTCAVSVGDRVLGTGLGTTKKQAQARAAAAALEELGQRPDRTSR